MPIMKLIEIGIRVEVTCRKPPCYVNGKKSGGKKKEEKKLRKTTAVPPYAKQLIIAIITIKNHYMDKKCMEMYS